MTESKAHKWEILLGIDIERFVTGNGTHFDDEEQDGNGNRWKRTSGWQINLIDWLIAWLIDWVIDLQVKKKITHWLVVDWFIRETMWLIDRLTDLLSDQPIVKNW